MVSMRTRKMVVWAPRLSGDREWVLGREREAWQGILMRGRVRGVPSQQVCQIGKALTAKHCPEVTICTYIHVGTYSEFLLRQASMRGQAASPFPISPRGQLAEKKLSLDIEE